MTVVAGSGVVVAVWELGCRILDRSRWPHGDVLERLFQGAQVPILLGMTAVMLSPAIGVWMVIARRRRRLDGVDGRDPNSFLPRGKYAFWKPARRAGGIRRSAR